MAQHVILLTTAVTAVLLVTASGRFRPLEAPIRIRAKKPTRQ